jgi:hypothetical protein
MRPSRILNYVVVLALSFSIIGCASVITGSADVDKTAFCPKKRFAVVTIASVKHFQGEKGLAQMFKSNDEFAGSNTQPMLDKLTPKILWSLDSSRNISIVPEKKVLNNKTYKNMQEDERVMKVMFFTNEMNTARKYKYISDPKKFAKLAKKLNVDGVIAINMSFSVTTSKGGVNLMGISLGKKSYSAVVSASALAYDKSGKVIWKDSTVKEAEEGDSKAIIVFDTSDLTATDFEKFHPSATEMGKKAMKTLVARFDDTMAGKKVSSMQSMK